MLDALVRLQVEVDPGVDAALAEVAVERAVVADTSGGACGGRGGRARPARAARPSLPSPPRRPSRRGSGRSRPGPTRGPSRGAPPRPRRRRASSTAARLAFLSRSISSRALSSDSSLLSPPNSTSSQPPPSGSSVMSCGWMPFFFMSVDEDVVEPLQAGRLELEDLARRGRPRCRRRDSRARAPT